jgi:lipopolysaccharide/colanic/teichoic acid biosynthesis glycosyltransferase
MPNRVELIFVSLAFLYRGIIIKREDDGPIFNRGVRVGRYNVGTG